VPRTAALFGILMSLPPSACTTLVRPGLTNAPALSGTPVDARVHDVIANGSDSCERRLGSGPLRNEVPPCPSGGRLPSRFPAVIQAPGETLPIEHDEMAWPCSLWDDPVSRVTLAGAFASPPTASGRALRGATCTAGWGEKR